MSVNVLGGVLEEAFTLNHRRMLVICGDDSFKLASSVKDFLVEACRRILRFRDGVSVLYAYHSFYDDALERLGIIESFRSDFGDEVDFQAISYKRTDTVLGLTFDGWWCLAENDVYYSDSTYVDGSSVKVERGSAPPIISGINDAWVRLDTDKTEAYMDAWFYNTFIGWSARAYAWTDPPNRGSYHYTY